MKIRRTLPPAAAPINVKDLLYGLPGFFLERKYREELEVKLKEYFKIRHVFLVSSGKAALALILLALKTLSPRREVLIPAYTCFSVPSAILKAGLRVALCDIELSSLDFHPERLREAINEETLCVVPDHLFGFPSEMSSINGYCKEKGVYVVEDAAQAMGNTYGRKLLGTLGDVGFFSLGRGKNITCGSGGIIITDSGRIAEAISGYYDRLEKPDRLGALKEYFQLVLMVVFAHPSLYWFPAGLPFLQLGQTLFDQNFPMQKMSGVKAALLRNWRDQLTQSNWVRTKTAFYFAEQLQLPTLRKNSVPYLRFPVLVDSSEVRNRIYSIAQKKGLGISLMYPTPINEIEEIKQTFNGEIFPVAKVVAERLLTLPTHHLLSEKDKSAICEVFNQDRSFKPISTLEKYLFTAETPSTQR